jgi:hypothetical protein
MRNRATQRKHVGRIPMKTSIGEYFFRQEKTDDGATILIPRVDFVTREELWHALEWTFRRLQQQNRWYRKLWRWATGKPLVAIDPFALVATKSPPPRQKAFDASGKVIEA